MISVVINDLTYKLTWDCKGNFRDAAGHIWIFHPSSGTFNSPQHPTIIFSTGFTFTEKEV
jgi:hypothetical protein